MPPPRPLLTALFLSLAIGASGQDILLDATFDGVANGTLEEFSFLGNEFGVAAGGNWDPDGGLLSMLQDVDSGGTMGIITDTAFDGAGLDVLQLTWAVEGIADPNNGPSNNGFFLGLTGQNEDLWNNSQNAAGSESQWAIGLRVGGGANTAAQHALHVTYNVPGAIRAVFPSMGTATVASLQDGFSAVLTLQPSGWDLSLTGLEDSAGNTLEGMAGTWDANFDFSRITADPTIYVASFYQQAAEAGTVVDYRLALATDGIADPDSDNDDLDDIWERLHFDDLDEVGNGDPDRDGLDNETEENLGTLPDEGDSDGDSLSDGEEVNGTLNPWAGGVQSGPPGDPTDPLNADSDSDGTNDDDEIAGGTDPNVAPQNTGPLFPFVDTDGDGYRDEAEEAFGSSPDDADDCPDHRPGTSKPNLVIIYADDMGFGDVSAYGDLFGSTSPVVTPNMDSLAAGGVTFTQGHSCNGVCTPSRYALLTGKYNWREFDGITGNWGGTIGGDELPRVQDVTIAEFLKAQQYDTAAFGKWHLGGAFYERDGTRITGNPRDPTLIDWERRVDLHAVDHGFDHFRGNACAINFVPYVYLVDARMQFWDTTLNGGSGGYRPALNTDPFRDWTRAQINAPVRGRKGSRDGLGDPSYSQVNVGPQLFSDVENYLSGRVTGGDTDPFFAYIAMHSPHYPWALTDEFVGDGVANGFLYADWMREVDDRVGRVLTALEDNGLASNTVVIFTADNGPEDGAMIDSIANSADSNGPLRGNKRDIWDGGTRVPFVVRWPGQAAAGMRVDHPVWQGDIFATIAAYLGAELPASTAPDGESFLNLLRGQRKPDPQRRAFVMSSIEGHLGLKTNDGWKFIDSTGGGGNGNSWDSSNARIASPPGSDRGNPKQLFRQSADLGEDINLIADLTDDTEIRSEITALAGEDLLGLLDQLRTTESTAIFPRLPDNDGDTMPNSYELAKGLDPDWPKDASTDLDGDGASNLAEFLAGTDPTDSRDVFMIRSFAPSDDLLNVSWSSLTSRLYKVMWSTDTVEWTSETMLPGSGAEIFYGIDLDRIDAADGVAGNLEHLLVRIEVSPAH